MNAATFTAPSPVFKRASWRAAAGLLALAWLVPFAIHLVPWSGARPLGAYLLPVFWTTLVAVYFYGGLVALAVGLFAPTLNFFVTGQPTFAYLTQTSLEILVFVVATAWAVRRAPHFLATAPLAYPVAKTLSAAMLAPDSLFGAAQNFFAHLAIGSWPGLAALALLNVALVRFSPKSSVQKNEAADL